MKRSSVYALVAVCFLAVNGWAQVSTYAPPQVPANRGVAAEALPIQPETYGTASQIKLQIPGASLTAIDAGNTLLEDGTGQYYSSAALARLVAGVNLPSGAQIQRIDLYYDDADAGNDIFVNLFSMDGTTTDIINIVGSVNSTGSAGRNVASSGALAHTVVNDNRQYMVYVANTSSLRKVRSVAIIYKLQISPDPSTATFTDVPVGSPYHRFVEALVAAGITGGCGGGNYCPDAPLTRGQMAVFLSGALGLHWVP